MIKNYLFVEVITTLIWFGNKLLTSTFIESSLSAKKVSKFYGKILLRIDN